MNILTFPTFLRSRVKGRMKRVCSIKSMQVGQLNAPLNGFQPFFPSLTDFWYWCLAGEKDSQRAGQASHSVVLRKYTRMHILLSSQKEGDSFLLQCVLLNTENYSSGGYGWFIIISLHTAEESLPWLVSATIYLPSEAKETCSVLGFQNVPLSLTR